MAENKEKLNVKQTFLISFAFLSVMTAWTIYNSYVPLILDSRLSEMQLSVTLVSFLTGFIMSIDSIFGVVFQPLFGKRSDHTRTRFGKRMPYLIVCMPVSAVLFYLIPKMAGISGTAGFWALMAIIVCFAFVMSIWRSPVIALMPEFTPPHLLSQANGIIGLMGGFGSLIGMIAGTIVGLFGFKEALEAGDYSSVFTVGSLLFLICMLIVYFKIKEKDNRLQSPEVGEANSAGQEKQSLKDLRLTKEERRSFLFMMVSLFFLNSGSKAITTFFTLFATETLGLSASRATLMMAVFAGALMAFSVPAGIMGKKLGRKKTISIGLIVIICMFSFYMISAFIVKADTLTTIALWAALVLGGCGIAMVNINTLPAVIAIGGRGREGAFTGYYYTATFSAAIVAPNLCGWVIGLMNKNYNFLFVFCTVVFSLSLLFISFTKHGNTMRGEEEEKEKVTINR